MFRFSKCICYKNTCNWYTMSRISTLQDIIIFLGKIKFRSVCIFVYNVLKNTLICTQTFFPSIWECYLVTYRVKLWKIWQSTNYCIINYQNSVLEFNCVSWLFRVIHFIHTKMLHVIVSVSNGCNRIQFW